MTHPRPEQLSDYLDGDLGPDEHRRLGVHLAACAGCTGLLADLQRVLARAQALEDRPPRHDLWPGVAAAIGAAPPRTRRIQFSVPMLLAASVALMVVSGSTVALLLPQMRGTPAVQQAPGALAATPAAMVSQPGSRGYDLAIRSLESQLTAGEQKLDSTTVRVVRQKLELIDRAIGEAERALATDPANSYLSGHLTETRLRKLDLLRRAAAMSRSVS